MRGAKVSAQNCGWCHRSLTDGTRLHADKAEAESARGSMSQSNTAIAEEPENGKISYHTGDTDSFFNHGT